MADIPPVSDPNMTGIGIGYETGPENYKLQKNVTMRINYGTGTLAGIDEGKLAPEKAVWVAVCNGVAVGLGVAVAGSGVAVLVGVSVGSTGGSTVSVKAPAPVSYPSTTMK